MNRKVGASGKRGEGSVLGRRCWVLLIFCLLLFVVVVFVLEAFNPKNKPTLQLEAQELPV